MKYVELTLNILLTWKFMISYSDAKYPNQCAITEKKNFWLKT